MIEGSKTILIVDDDEGVAEAVRLVLDEAGYRTKIAMTADTARNAIAEPTTIAGAVIDVWLGGEIGLELAEKIGAVCPFVIMSGGGPGRSLDTVAAQADVIGATAVLFKPFEDEELLGAVARMVVQT